MAATGKSSNSQGLPAITSVEAAAINYTDRETKMLNEKASTFKFEANNSASSKSNNSQKVILNFKPNILDNYDAVTYHYKIYMLSIANMSSGNIYDTSSQVIIAESGVTDIMIDNVEIKSVCTPAIDVGTGTATNFKFDLIEPAGCSLLDKMFYEAVTLGVGNWTTMPIYIQLSFRGRDITTSSTGNETSGLESLNWVWPIRLSKTAMTVSEKGTTYAFEGVLYNNVLQSNVFFSMQHNVTLSSVQTFGDAMKELESKLNADQLLTLIDNYSIADSYKIIVDPVLASCNIVQPNNNKNPMRNDSYVKFNDKSATFTSGTGIDKVIDTLLQNSDKFQKDMVGAPTPGENGVPLSSEKSQMKKLWRIVTETRPLMFDKRRMDLAKEFTIFVIEYDISTLDSDTVQANNPGVSKDASIKRLSTYADKGILNKKYNYIFTGTNDQILKFDLTLNNAYAIACARFGGRYLNTSMSDHGPIINQSNQKDTERIQTALTAAMSLQFNDATADSKDAKKAIDEYKKAIAASTSLTSTELDRYNTLLANAKTSSRLSYIAQTQSTGGILQNGSIDTTVKNATLAAEPTTQFISDVNASSLVNNYNDFLSSKAAIQHPVAQIEQTQNQSGGQGVEANSNPGVSKAASMFSLALHSGMGANLQAIKMSIKGDPYWLFPHPVQTNIKYYNSMKPESEAIDFLKKSHILYPGGVNLLGTDNLILIRLRTAIQFDSSQNITDQSPTTDANMVSGVYRVITVDNKWTGGIFTQELQCILDPVINIQDITSLIEDNAKQLDVPATPSDFMALESVPSTAFKQADILSYRAQMNANIAAGKTTILTSANVGLAQAANLLPASNIPTSAPNVLNGLPNIYK